MDTAAQSELRAQLKQHRRNLLKHLQHASEFLVRCQVLEPYVEKGSLRGTVCPWEIATADPLGFTIFEDFHDTLQAIWVWSYYTYKSHRSTFLLHIKSAWDYILKNFHRFIPPSNQNQGLYDSAHLLNTALIYKQTFADNFLHTWVEEAGNRLAIHLDTLRRARGRSYSDPWWMTYCLASAAQEFGFSKMG